MKLIILLLSFLFLFFGFAYATPCFDNNSTILINSNVTCTDTVTYLNSNISVEDTKSLTLFNSTIYDNLWLNYINVSMYGLIYLDFNSLIFSKENLPVMIEYASINFSSYQCGVKHEIHLVSLCVDIDGEQGCWNNNTADIRCWDMNSTIDYPDVVLNYSDENCTGDVWASGKMCDVSILADSFDICGNVTCSWFATDGEYNDTVSDMEMVKIVNIDPIDIMVEKKGLHWLYILLLSFVGISCVALGFMSRHDFYYYLAGSIFIIIGLLVINYGVFYDSGQSLELLLCETCSGYAQVNENEWAEIPFRNPSGVLNILLGLALVFQPLIRKKD